MTEVYTNKSVPLRQFADGTVAFSLSSKPADTLWSVGEFVKGWAQAVCVDADEGGESEPLLGTVAKIRTKALEDRFVWEHGSWVAQERDDSLDDSRAVSSPQDAPVAKTATTAPAGADESKDGPGTASDGHSESSPLDRDEEAVVRGRPMSIQLSRYRQGYVSVPRGKGKSKATSNGDALARALLPFEPDQVVSILSVWLADREILTRWDHLNPGQRRMNAGNMIRSRIRKAANAEGGERDVQRLQAIVNKMWSQEIGEDNAEPDAIVKMAQSLRLHDESSGRPSS